MQKTKHILVSSTDLQKGLKLNGFFGRITSILLMRIFSLNKLNKYYDRNYSNDALEFCKNCLDSNNNKIIVPKSDFHNIPETGAFVILFNHPFGGVDALAIMQTIHQVRPDTKFIANFLLSRIEPVAPFLSQVNPFESRKDAFSSLNGLKEMYKHIENDHPVCILPAGEVSTRYGKSKIIEDKEWHTNTMKFITTTGIPVISGYISGQNSNLFHFMGKINPVLRTAMLPREFLRKKNQNIYIRLSGQLNTKTIKSIEDKNTLGKILKAKTYCLADDCVLSNSHKEKIIEYKQTIEPVSKEKLLTEIKLLKSESLLFQTDNYLCFFAETNSIPLIFTEISRLREITFREVGEGTGRDCDFDEYDSYYNHLFIWDENNESLVGAYRIGMGEEILKKHDLTGFYINSLFTFSDEIKPYLQKSMEMGRSFIVSEYQRKPLPLFLLWKGIYHVTQKYPQYKYLIGPASISNLYSDNSKTILIEYLKRNHMWPELSKMIKCKTPYKYTLNHHHEVILETLGNDLSLIDRLVRDIDLHHMGMPVLIKKYLSLGGKIIDFNVDPDFNYSIDGFIVLDIDVVSEEVIKSYHK
jgi:putative hemolysin